MAKPRAPVERARITGAIKKDPARFSQRANPRSGPLGAAPGWMRAEARRAWELFKKEIPWLAEADRGLVEIAASIRGRLMAGEDVGVSALNQLRMCYGQMGATPADRTKVHIPDEPEEDPTDRFFANLN